MKKTFFHGITAGILASIAAIIFNYAYTTAMFVDFSSIINVASLIGGCMFGTVAASVGYYFFSKWVKVRTDVWFNIILLLLTFASFVNSFSFQLPLDIESPEMFAGLSVPLHMFPALFWLATKPLFAGA